jgi:hypothetical protein
MRRRLFVAALLAVAGTLGAVPAVADTAQSTVVSADPVDFTPHVLDGTVWSVAVVGDAVVVGGTFTKVTDKTGTTTYNRRNIFAYGLNDGVVRPFAPQVDGSVYALTPGATSTVYIGGSFRTVGGVAQRGLARVTMATGARVGSFKASINWGDVRAMTARGTRLYVGGTFSAINGVSRAALARLSSGTGAVDTAFDAKLTAPGLSRTRVEHFDLSPDGTRLVAVGALLKANGLDRTQIVMYDVSGSTAVVANWYTNAYKPVCMEGFDTYLRQVKFSPDGHWFVVVATGRASSPSKLCDSAARFNVAGVGVHPPAWVQLTGGDSLYAVAVTGAAVYVGGHQRFLDNPTGTDTSPPGPTAVKRPGIGALNPLTGKALAWNPTRTPRGVGVRALVTTPNYLIVGSDTEQLGKEYHARIGMFPLN